MTNDQLTIFNDEQKTRLHLEPVNPALVVIPAEAGIQYFQGSLDAGSGPA